MKKYYPTKGMRIEIPAGKPFNSGTSYVVTKGVESIEGEMHEVIKIHLSIDGDIKHRVSPSFSSNILDFMKVTNAVFELEKRKSNET